MKEVFLEMTRETPAEEETVEFRYRKLTGQLIQDGQTVATMESCTSGQLVSLLTDTEGASSVVRGGVVPYSNDAKVRAGVSADVINACGVYSRETAEAMADAARSFFGTKLGIGVTGTFANADPVNADSIPGVVYVSARTEEQIVTARLTLSGEMTRRQAKRTVADALWEMLTRNGVVSIQEE